jgi:acetyl-CoA acyltransferase
MEKCVIVEYGRSAVGKARKGSLAKANPVDFGAEVLKGVLDKIPKLDQRSIDDIIIGCAIPEGKMGLNPARNIALRAGIPDSVPAQTVNRFCSSGIQSVAIGSAMIKSGLQDIVVAGGVESMTCPVISEKEEYLNKWLLENTQAYIPMGFTAENVAKKYNVSRREMEEMAVESHKKAAEAEKRGFFDREIIPVTGYDDQGNPFKFTKDEGIREETSIEILSKLKPAFLEDGLVTAATSSPRSDGAGFVVLMSESKARKLNIKPIAEFQTYAVKGLDPAYMGLGPIYAVKKLFTKTDLSLEDMDVIELNEAFASQAIATIRDLNLDKNKVNPRGGALALGHPLGATGTILLSKALNYLKDTGGKYGLITMCIGGGMGAAGIVKMID